MPHYIHNTTQQKTKLTKIKNFFKECNVNIFKYTQILTVVINLTKSLLNGKRHLRNHTAIT